MKSLSLCMLLLMFGIPPLAHEAAANPAFGKMKKMVEFKRVVGEQH